MLSPLTTEDKIIIGIWIWIMLIPSYLLFSFVLSIVER
jgi:hypothetical protein